jgi:hypothetical protein
LPKLVTYRYDKVHSTKSLERKKGRNSWSASKNKLAPWHSMIVSHRSTLPSSEIPGISYEIAVLSVISATKKKHMLVHGWQSLMSRFECCKEMTAITDAEIHPPFLPLQLHGPQLNKKKMSE